MLLLLAVVLVGIFVIGGVTAIIVKDGGYRDVTGASGFRDARSRPRGRG